MSCQDPFLCSVCHGVSSMSCQDPLYVPYTIVCHVKTPSWVQYAIVLVVCHVKTPSWVQYAIVLVVCHVKTPSWVLYAIVLVVCHVKTPSCVQYALLLVICHSGPPPVFSVVKTCSYLLHLRVSTCLKTNGNNAKQRRVGAGEHAVDGWRKARLI